VLQDKETGQERVSDIVKGLELKEQWPRSMAELSDKFIKHKVANVEGVLLWINKEILPYLKMSEEEIVKRFSIFVDCSDGEAGQHLLGLPDHTRTLFLSIKFLDKDGRRWNYITIKGVGLPKFSHMPEGAETIQRNIDDVWGLSHREDVEKDCKISKKLNEIEAETRLPITTMPIAIIELKKVRLKNGEKVSVKELKEQFIIPENFTPVLYVRGFSEVMRVSDARKSDIRKFAKEHGIKFEEYPSWLMGRLAENLAKTHSAGITHENLFTDNIGIDGCIVDWDTARDVNPNSPEAYNSIAKDVRMLMDGVSEKLRKLKVSSVSKNTEELIFLKKYVESRRDLGKDGFKEIYVPLKEKLPNPDEGIVTEIESLFEKRFGEKLET
jgi:hypothetical protein